MTKDQLNRRLRDCEAALDAVRVVVEDHARKSREERANYRRELFEQLAEESRQAENQNERTGP